MPKPQDIRKVREQTRAEHEELRELLGAVQRTLAKRLASVAHVAEMLENLNEQLCTHFATEEDTGGFFDEVIREAPRLTERAEAVRLEHSQLGHAMRELRTCAENESAGDWWKQLEAKFQDFANQLLQHENQESELLLDALADDIGTKD